MTTWAWIFFVAYWLMTVVAALFAFASIRLAAAVNQARGLLEKAAESDSEQVRELIEDYLRRTA